MTGYLGRLGVGLLATVAVILMLPAFSGLAWADTFVAGEAGVDAPDAKPGDGKCDATAGTPGRQCTLRAAVQEANALDGRDTIVLNEGTYILTLPNADRTGDLSPDPEGRSKTGDLDILDAATIKGAGLEETIIRDEAGDRVFHVHRGAVRAVIAGLTVSGGNGSSVTDDPTTDPDGLSPRGGGIVNTATLELRSVAVRDNEADFGGGIDNAGKLTMKGTTVDGNTASFGGGGVYNEGPLRVTDSTVSSNRAGRDIGDGGGFGGGLYNKSASASLTNTTIAFNTASAGLTQGRGGGIANVFGDVELLNVTVNENVSPEGASVANTSGQTYLKNTIVADGAQTENCTGERTVSRGNNLSDDGSCNLNEPGDSSNEDPRLAPISDDDDPAAQIFEPQPGSPAIDEASNRACPPVDQRGLERPKDGDGAGGAVCDVGSVEANSQDPGP